MDSKDSWIAQSNPYLYYKFENDCACLLRFYAMKACFKTLSFNSWNAWKDLKI